MPTPAAALGNLNVVRLRRSDAARSVPSPAIFARRCRAGAARARRRACPAAPRWATACPRRSPIPPNTISTIASSSSRAQGARKPIRRIAGPDGEGRDRRRAARWWRRWPIATNTSRCAASRNWPRKPGRRTGARNRNRKPDAAAPAPAPITPAPLSGVPAASRRRGELARHRNARGSLPGPRCSRPASRPPVVDPVLPRQHSLPGPAP